MPGGLPLSDRLDTCVEVMTALALPFPSSFVADAERAELASVLPEGTLAPRSIGPYSADRLPAEHDRMITRIELRWQGRFERPDLTVAVGGEWPELVMVLPASQVVVRLLMPEAGLEGAHSPWSLGLVSDLKMALQWVAGVVRWAGEPPVRVAVTYASDPEADRQRAQLPPDFQDAYPPVVGTVGIDLGRCGEPERRGFHDAARASTSSGQAIDWTPGGGFTMRLGFAAVHAAVTGVG